MNMKKLLAALMALVMTMSLMLSAVAEAPAETVEMPEVTMDAGDPADVLVTVNGAEVTRQQVDAMYDELVGYYAQSNIQVDSEEAAALVMASAVTASVQTVVQSLKAAELGLQPADDELTKLIEDGLTEWQEIIDMYVTYYGGLTAEATDEEKLAARENVVNMLTEAGYTEELYLEEYVLNEINGRVRAYVVDGITVTDEEIAAQYDEYAARDEATYNGNIMIYEYYTTMQGATSFYTPEGYRGIIHILLTVDQELLNAYTEAKNALESSAEGATQEAVDAAKEAVLASVKEQTDAIYDAIEKGEDFYALIDQYGQDPGMSQGAANREGGYPVHKDSIVWDPVFTAAAFSVENVGDVAEPVVGSYGVHIVKYLRDIPAGRAEMTEEVKAQLGQEMLSARQSEAYSNAIRTWTSEADIVYSEEAQAIIDNADAIMAAAMAEAEAQSAAEAQPEEAQSEAAAQ